MNNILKRDSYIWMFLVPLVLLASGCVSQEFRASIVALQRDHQTFQRAVVPDPSYGDEERDAVVGLGNDIAAHLEKLEELTR